MVKLFFFLIFCNMNSDLIIFFLGEKFDKQYFNSFQKNGRYQYYNGSYKVSVFDVGTDFYYERATSDSNAVEYRISYYKDTLTPASTTMKFYDMYIGQIRQYDKNQKLIEIENVDNAYPYSVDDVVQWVKDKYNVDLNKKPRWAMMSRSTNPIPHYMLRFIDNDGQRIVYSIDARDGSLIYENIAGEEKTYKDVRDWWRNPDGTKIKRR